MKRTFVLAVPCLVTLSLSGQEKLADPQVKFLKLLISSTGQFGFACSDPALKTQLEANGISVSPGFKMAWANSEAETKVLKGAGKLVVVPKLAWLKAGGSVAIVMEDGKPLLYINPVHLKASGLQLSDTIMKIAKF
jgi:hypothetical protein